MRKYIPICLPRSISLKIIILLGMFLFVAEGFTQNIDETILREAEFRKTGMLVLGGWAIGNIVSGVIMRSRTEGATSRFYEMNALWNTVNLAIAGIGYYSATRFSPTSGSELYLEYTQLDKILLINAGLDLAYMATGFYLREYSKREGVNSDLFKGYGSSLIMQGAFLFVFDLGMVFLHPEIELNENLILGFQALPGAFRCSLQF